MIAIVINITDLPAKKIVAQSIQEQSAEVSKAERQIFEVYKKHLRRAMEECSQLGAGGSWAEGENAVEKAVHRLNMRHGK